MNADHHGLDRSMTSALKSHPDAALTLPHPSETWRFEDIDDLSHTAFSVFVRRGVVQVVDRRRDGRYRWRTARRAYEWAREHCQPGDRLPCGHRGIRNLGESYTCMNEACDREFSRAVVAEVLDA